MRSGSHISVKIGMITDKNIYLSEKKADGQILNICMSWKEARQVSRALLCYADIAEQLNQDWPEEKAVILQPQEKTS